jgi:hypothetical protein
MRRVSHDTAAKLLREAADLEARDPRSELARVFRGMAARADGQPPDPPPTPREPVGRERALPPERDDEHPEPGASG